MVYRVCTCTLNVHVHTHTCYMNVLDSYTPVRRSRQLEVARNEILKIITGRGSLATHCRPNSRHCPPPNPVRSRRHWPRRRSPPTPRHPPSHWHHRSNRIRWIFPPPILNGTTFCATPHPRLCRPRATFSFPLAWAVS